MIKRILLISDSHGRTDIVKKIFKSAAGKYDFSIFLGDFVSDEAYYVKQFDIAVPGNNDWNSSLPAIIKFNIDNDWAAIACHSDQFGYYNRGAKMIKWAQKEKVQIIFCGHTHIPQFEEYNNVYLINPGSCAYPRSDDGATYAILQIVDNTTLKYDLYKI